MKSKMIIALSELVMLTVIDGKAFIDIIKEKAVNQTEVLVNDFDCVESAQKYSLSIVELEELRYTSLQELQPAEHNGYLILDDECKVSKSSKIFLFQFQSIKNQKNRYHSWYLFNPNKTC